MKNRAFTFIEILVVTAIISLLTGSSTVVYTSFSKQSRDARRKTDLQQVRTVLELYRSNNNSYPPALTFSQYLCDPAGCKDQGGTTYIEKLPQDPVPNKTYSYINGDDNFLLSATLENGSKYCLNRYGEDDACSTLLAAAPTSTPVPQIPTATPIPWQPTNTPTPIQPTNTPTATPIPTATPTPIPYGYDCSNSCTAPVMNGAYPGSSQCNSVCYASYDYGGNDWGNDWSSNDCGCNPSSEPDNCPLDNNSYSI